MSDCSSLLNDDPLAPCRSPGSRIAPRFIAGDGHPPAKRTQKKELIRLEGSTLVIRNRPALEALAA
jgi:hypothetical protein